MQLWGKDMSSSNDTGVDSRDWLISIIFLLTMFFGCFFVTTILGLLIDGGVI